VLDELGLLALLQLAVLEDLLGERPHLVEGGCLDVRVLPEVIYFIFHL
jgi:hypothetical protein